MEQKEIKKTLKNQGIKSVIEFFKKHKWYSIVSLLIFVLQIIGIILQCKILAISLAVIMLIFSLYNRFKDDTIDCGEF